MSHDPCPKSPPLLLRRPSVRDHAAAICAKPCQGDPRARFEHPRAGIQPPSACRRGRSGRVGAARPECEEQVVEPGGVRAVPAAGTGPTGGPRRTRRPLDQCRESGGERAKLSCQTGSAAGIVVCAGCGTFDRKERQGHASGLRCERPRRPLGGTQQPEHDVTNGPGAAGRPLGKAGEREQQGNDAPKRFVMSLVRRIPLHARIHAQEKAV